MTRDPRRDPRPGDVVRIEDAEHWSVRVVIERRGASVTWSTTAPERTPTCMTADVKLWRGVHEWPTATVLHPLGVTYDGSPALADDLSDGRWSGR